MRASSGTSRSGWLAVAFRRVSQFRAALRPPTALFDERLRKALDDERQWRLVYRLSAYDRRHAYDVYLRLVEEGHRDADLLRAAILHDIGKADDRHRVRLIHRVLWVFARCVAGDAVRRSGTVRHHSVWRGLFLAANHAQLGAELARSSGLSERCCELIRRHEERPPTGDRELDALIAADEGFHL